MTRAICPRVNTWTCRDTEHVLHLAKVSRYFNDDGKLVQVDVTLACCPTTVTAIPAKGDWHGRKLPPVVHPGSSGNGRVTLTLIEYGVREAPTCVKCAVARLL